MASIRKRSWTSAQERQAAAREGREAVKDREAWQVDFIDQNGKRHQPQFARRAEADSWLTEARAKVQAGVYTPDAASATLSEAARLWLSRAEAEGLEYGTRRQYQQHVDHILAVISGKTKLSRLTQARCEQARDELLKAHSRELARAVLRSLKSILKDARRRSLITHSPAADTAIGTNGRYKRKLKAGVDFPLPAEIKTMIDVSEAKGRAAICLAALAGLRASEIRALRWADLRLDGASSVTVEQRADKWAQIGSPKSEASHRTVPLGGIAARALKEWKVAQPPGRSLVFSTASNRPDMLSNLTRRLLAPFYTSGMVRRYGWHALRHYAISTWLKSCKGDFKLVQTWAGHGTLSQTLDRYGHLIPRDDQHDVIAAAERELC